MISWINRKFNLNISIYDLNNIKDFSLIWNIFDNYIFQSNFSISTAEQKYFEKDFAMHDFEEFFNYFRNRYIENRLTNEKFNNLEFRTNDRKDFVRNVLLQDIIDIKSKILAMTIIVYRYRNNLFHGKKDFRFLDQQNDNFEIANRFLMAVMNYY